MRLVVRKIDPSLRGVGSLAGPQFDGAAHFRLAIPFAQFTCQYCQIGKTLGIDFTACVEIDQPLAGKGTVA